MASRHVNCITPTRMCDTMELCTAVAPPTLITLSLTHSHSHSPSPPCPRPPSLFSPPLPMSLSLSYGVSLSLCPMESPYLSVLWSLLISLSYGVSISLRPKESPSLVLLCSRNRKQGINVFRDGEANVSLIVSVHMWLLFVPPLLSSYYTLLHSLPHAQVILYSSDPGFAAECVLSIVALLYPLQYLFPVIPLLPTCMPTTENVCIERNFQLLYLFHCSIRSQS